MKPAPALCVATLVVLLAGCAVDDAETTPSPSVTATPSATATPQATPTSTASRTATTTTSASPSATKTTPGTTGATASARQTPARTGSPAPPANPNMANFGDATVGWVALPKDWTECVSSVGRQFCDPTNNYRLRLQSDQGSPGVTGAHAWDAQLWAMEEAECQAIGTGQATVNGLAAKTATGECPTGQMVSVVLVTGSDDWHVLVFEGVGGVAYPSYYDPAVAAYTW